MLAKKWARVRVMKPKGKIEQITGGWGGEGKTERIPDWRGHATTGREDKTGGDKHQPPLPVTRKVHYNHQSQLKRGHTRDKPQRGRKKAGRLEYREQMGERDEE